ncbi:hypothetical protein AVDCRST_MAG84-4817, partial [uncultured Microcoleus sp.]
PQCPSRRFADLGRYLWLCSKIQKSSHRLL